MRPGDHQPVTQFRLARQSLLMLSLCQLTLGQPCLSLLYYCCLIFSHPFLLLHPRQQLPPRVLVSRLEIQGSLSLPQVLVSRMEILVSLSPSYPKSVFTSCPTEVGQIKPECSYTDLHVISSQTSDLRTPNIFLSRSVSFFSITISISFVVTSM